ncbi:MAG: hypothetical protein RM022_016435 [Nostoc sp. EfeVER01]|uniref:hypothetical protein n=1 Tax=unclassified Nostoc TaxID=2593658 RepID=UPI002AD25280|nr:MULTISPECIES: hypothetical protein [unclassified Nostoc]MDZ7945981.1 hypothetical protein [Nostoc sp. EfeVER01]MDZ7990744.1 hypothetical protein [Nostoc sp. EspVER01]
MSHISNQTQDLYSIDLVQDLDHEAAATVSGGTLTLYDTVVGPGPLRGTRSSDRNLGADPNIDDFDNRASSYQVTPGQIWIGYLGTGFTNSSILLTPNGRKPLPALFNNRISSVRRIV